MGNIAVSAGYGAFVAIVCVAVWQWLAPESAWMVGGMIAGLVGADTYRRTRSQP